MLKKLRIGLALLVLIEVGCVKLPQAGKGEVFSVLFGFSARVGENSYHSLRLYVNSDKNKRLTLNIMLPTNKLIANVFYDGKKLIIVDYKNRIAYIDNKKPFNLKRVIGFDIPVSEFVVFYNRCYLEKGCDFKEVKGIKFIVNGKGEIAIAGKKGNVLLKPLSGVVKGGVASLSPTIPEGFKVVYDNS